MNRIRTSALAVVFTYAAASYAFAAPGVNLAPTTGHPKATTQVSGSGFGTSEAVDIYFDTTDMLLGVTDGSGNFGKYPLKVPANALPGTHWITAIGRKSGDAGQKTFTVRTNWAQYGFTAPGSHGNPYENVISSSAVSDLTLAWSAPANNAFSSPAISGGVAYVGGDLGGLRAFTVSTGALRWTATGCGEVFLSSPAVANGIVYVGCYADGKLYAYSASNGSLKWSQTAGGFHITSSPTVANGVVYVGSEDDNLYAFDAISGTPLWTYATGVGVDSSPAVAHGVVYFGSNDSKLYALNAATGALIWSGNTGGSIIGSPTVANGAVYIGSNDGYLYAFNGATGGVNWTFNTGGAIGAAPAFSNGVVFTGNADTQTFFALSAGYGTLLWSANIGATAFAAPSVADGVVYASAGSVIHALNASSGVELWNTTEGNDYSSPVIADGMLYVGSGTFDNNLHAFALDAGDNAIYHRNPAPPPYASLHPDYRLKRARVLHP